MGLQCFPPPASFAGGLSVKWLDEEQDGWEFLPLCGTDPRTLPTAFYSELSEQMSAYPTIVLLVCDRETVVVQKQYVRRYCAAEQVMCTQFIRRFFDENICWLTTLPN